MEIAKTLGILITIGVLFCSRYTAAKLWRSTLRVSCRNSGHTQIRVRFLEHHNIWIDTVIHLPLQLVPHVSSSVDHDPRVATSHTYYDTANACECHEDEYRVVGNVRRGHQCVDILTRYKCRFCPCIHSNLGFAHIFGATQRWGISYGACFRHHCLVLRSRREDQCISILPNIWRWWWSYG